MARKSRLDVIKERLGGKWKYDLHDGWNCEDGRRIFKQLNCSCWIWGANCNCEPVFMLTDKSGTHEINLDDPKIYDLNGKFSKKKRKT